jgi:hypothetical protein
VRADLDAGHFAEDAEERQRVVDLGGDGVFPDPLIDAPLSDRDLADRCIPNRVEWPEVAA